MGPIWEWLSLWPDKIQTVVSRVKMHLQNVISVCSIDDIHAWKSASPRIIQNIYSKNYTVIVPSKDLKAFAECTPSNFSVISEDEYVSTAFAMQLRERTAASTVGIRRYGWYLQQFIKLSALERTPNREVSLIWDADTVPLKRLTYEKAGKILFYKGDEYHKPYFKVIASLLGLQKTNPFSFIAQCLPCRGSWAKDLFRTIEDRTQKSWKEGILDFIDFNELSGFSEYETVGTFVASNYPKDFAILDNRWCRWGNGLIGSIDNLRLCEGVLRLRYDFISFEKWNLPYSLYSGRRLRQHFKRIFPS